MNIAARNDFVVHIPPAEMAEAVTATSKALPHGESEIDFAKLTTVAVEGEALPRIVGPKAAMFFKKYQIFEVGDEKVGLILGKVKKIWIDDAAAGVKDGRILIDPLKLNPLTRLGETNYAPIGNVFSVARPK